MPSLPTLLILLPLILPSSALTTRWASSTLTLNSTLLLLTGGKSDPTSLYTYSSSPTLSLSPILVLPLTHNFSTSSPPWVEVQPFLSAGSAPASAWGTLGDLGGGEILGFGGDGGTAQAVQTGNDSTYSIYMSSATLGALKTYNPTNLTQPIRKIYSAASSSPATGAMFLTGGLRDDGSGISYSEAWKYTTATGYTVLPNLPTTLIHHQSVLLANGTLLLLGGYIPESTSFLPLTTLYSLDTTSSTSTWSTLIIPSPAPPSRRGHSVTYNPGTNEIFLFGGIATSLQGTVLSDGWVLDLTKGSWEQVIAGTATAGAGGRYDAAVWGVGGLVFIFGGHAATGPADDALYLFDTATKTWLQEFLPASIASSTSSATGSATGSSSQTGTGVTTAKATATVKTGTYIPFTTSGLPTPASAAELAANRTKGVALGTTFGALVLIAVGAAYLVVRRKKRKAVRESALYGYGAAASGGGGGGGGKRGGRKWWALGRARKGEGAEDLIEKKWRSQGDDDAWDVSEKDLEGPMTGVGAGNNRYSGLAGIGARRDMLADEDRSDVGWRRGSMVESDEAGSILGVLGGRPESLASLDTYDDPFSNRNSQMAPVASTRYSQAYDQDDSSSRGHGSDNRDPFEEPLERYYDPAVVAFAYQDDDTTPTKRRSLPVPGQNDRKPSESSALTGDTGNSSGHATMQTAKVLPQNYADAEYVPVGRSGSFLKRLTGSLFNSDSGPALPLFDFRDPSTPPALDPLDDRSQRSAPSAFPRMGRVEEHGRSMSSVVSAKTMNTERLEQYGQMDIAQRQRDISSDSRGSGRTSPQESDISDNSSRGREINANPFSDSHNLERSLSPLRPAPPLRGPRPSPRAPAGASTRSVKDIAASINKRSPVLDSPDLMTPSPVEAAASTFGAPPPPMHSPGRHGGPTRVTNGPRPRMMYEFQPRAALSVTN